MADFQRLYTVLETRLREDPMRVYMWHQVANNPDYFVCSECLKMKVGTTKQMKARIRVKNARILDDPENPSTPHLCTPLFYRDRFARRLRAKMFKEFHRSGMGIEQFYEKFRRKIETADEMLQFTPEDRSYILQKIRGLPDKPPPRLFIPSDYGHCRYVPAPPSCPFRVFETLHRDNPKRVYHWQECSDNAELYRCLGCHPKRVTIRVKNGRILEDPDNPHRKPHVCIPFLYIEKFALRLRHLKYREGQRDVLKGDDFMLKFSYRVDAMEEYQQLDLDEQEYVMKAVLGASFERIMERRLELRAHGDEMSYNFDGSFDSHSDCGGGRAEGFENQFEHATMKMEMDTADKKPTLELIGASEAPQEMLKESSNSAPTEEFSRGDHTLSLTDLFTANKDSKPPAKGMEDEFEEFLSDPEPDDANSSNPSEASEKKPEDFETPCESKPGFVYQWTSFGPAHLGFQGFICKGCVEALRGKDLPRKCAVVRCLDGRMVDDSNSPETPHVCEPRPSTASLHILKRLHKELVGEFNHRLHTLLDIPNFCAATLQGLQATDSEFQKLDKGKVKSVMKGVAIECERMLTKTLQKRLPSVAKEPSVLESRKRPILTASTSGIVKYPKTVNLSDIPCAPLPKTVEK